MMALTGKRGGKTRWLLAAVLLAGGILPGCSGKKDKDKPDDNPDGQNLPLAARLYRRHCAQCHGNEGKGNGPGGVKFTNPPPADFTRGKITRGEGSEAI